MLSTTIAQRGQYAYAVTTHTTYPVPATIASLSFTISAQYPTLHVVLDCPQDANGLVDVTATAASGGACTISLVPHASGNGLHANPASFWVSPSCAVYEEVTSPGKLDCLMSENADSYVLASQCGSSCSAQGWRSCLPQR